MGSRDAEKREKSYWDITSKPCDSCKSSPSVLYCRADSAFLCSSCDSRIHSANKLASRHDRVWLCEVCDQTPASVTCKADAASLCASCDADIHSANPLARRHERVPVVPFFDSAVAEVNKIYNCGFGLKEDDLVFGLKKDDLVLKEEVDYFFVDVDPYGELEYADSVVPVQSSKGVGLGVTAVQQTGDVFEFAAAAKPSYSTCSSEVGVVPDTIGDVSAGYTSVKSGTQMSVDREARVMRYREKRKNRKFEKTIRYASRKAYAETRPRIKGRFAKRTEVEGMYLSASMAGIKADSGYGIVPSF